MSMRTYLSLPINADEGFPQAFRLSFGGQVYQILLYANVAEHIAAQAAPDEVFSLPQDGAFLVMRALRESPDGLTAIFQRKLVPELEYEAAELAFIFHTMQVAKKNLNGQGAFGSVVRGGIAARWAS
jgi:hypothetical protein